MWMEPHLSLIQCIESRFLYDIIITAKGNPVCLTSHGALAEGKKERIHDASGTEKITLLCYFSHSCLCHRRPCLRGAEKRSFILLTPQRNWHFSVGRVCYATEIRERLFFLLKYCREQTKKDNERAAGER